MNLILREGAFDFGAAAVSESMLGRQASAIVISRQANNIGLDGGWYYRCIGTNGTDLVELEIRAGQLVSVGLAIVRQDLSVLAAARSMETEVIDFNPFLSLELFCTKNFDSIIRNGVNVKIDPVVARSDCRVLIGLGFDRVRRALRAPDGLIYYVDERSVLTGISLALGA